MLVGTFLLPIAATVLKNDVALTVEGLVLIIAIVSRVVVLVLLHRLQLVEELFLLKFAGAVDLVFGDWVVKSPS